MHSGWLGLAIVIVIIAMGHWQTILERYEGDRRRTEWDYCTGAASFRDVATWWWRRKFA